MSSKDRIHLHEFVTSIRTPENGDELDLFISNVRRDQAAGAFRKRMLRAEWMEAACLLMRIAPAICREADDAVPDADGIITITLDDETALDLISHGRGKH